MSEALGTRSSPDCGVVPPPGSGSGVSVPATVALSQPTLIEDERCFTPAERWALWFSNPRRLLGRCEPSPPAPNWMDASLLMDRLRLGARWGFLQDNFPEDVCAEFATLLRNARREAAALNLMMETEQQQVLSQLRAAGLSAFAIKGVALARILHGDPAARHVSDIDLAIPQGELADAARVLAGESYRVLLPQELLRRRSFLNSANVNTAEAGAVKQGISGRVLVEMHWKLFPYDNGAAWPTEAYHDVQVAALPPTHYFLYLAQRLAAHGWTDLSKLCDLGDFLLRHATRLNASLFWQLAARHGQRRGVSISLELLTDIFGITWTQAQPTGEDRFMAKQFLRRPLLRKWNGTPAEYHAEQRRITEGALRRVSMALRLLRPTKEEWVRGEGVRSAVGAWAWRQWRLAKMAAGVGSRSEE